MKVIVTPGKIKGKIKVIASKSYAHRMLIAAALSDAPTEVLCPGNSEDVMATVECLRNLGAIMEPLEPTDERNHEAYRDAISRGIRVIPISKKVGAGVLDCKESGSTLRFLLPVAAVLTNEVSFTGKGRLPMRPIRELVCLLSQRGKNFTGDGIPFSMGGALRAGTYPVSGNISSQYITGLLLALPLLKEDSKIQLTTQILSKGYIDVTLDVLKQFQILVEEQEDGYWISGGQQYTSPKRIEVEGDWSNGTFFLVAQRLGNDIMIEGLAPESKQADRKVVELLDKMEQGEHGSIDLSQMPDALPALCVFASMTAGTTVFTGLERLRLKESDRITSCYEMIKNLGGRIHMEGDTLIVEGTGLIGGTVDSYNDHRIAMAAAIAGLVCKQPVTITDAQSVEKSYPNFYEELKRLGATISIQDEE